jgi:hypothetical protein
MGGVLVTYQQPRSKHWKASFQLEKKKPSYHGIAPIHIPLVCGDLGLISGILEGLSGLGVHGTLTMVIHEGLYELNSDLTVFHPHYPFLIQAILARVAITAGGLAAQFPRIEFRINFTYTLEWES